MKFKQLTIDESLIEDFSIPHSSKSNVENSSLFDDDFSAPEYIPDMTTSQPQGPQLGSDTGIADLIIASINDEWETIRNYNSIVNTLKYEAANNSDYSDMIVVLTDIINEENRHVGQLQEMLKKISPNVSEIKEGEKEAQKQFNFVNGKLPVQMMEVNNVSSHSDVVDELSDVCTISDIDDEI